MILIMNGYDDYLYYYLMITLGVNWSDIVITYCRYDYGSDLVVNLRTELRVVDFILDIVSCFVYFLNLNHLY